LNDETYIVAFWQCISASVATIAMCVLALPFAFGSLRSSGTGARVAVGVIIGLAYFLAANGIIDGGALYGINPILTAWLPTIALSVCVVVALSRAR
jgi:lipopolysaccharide export system permease protein